MSKVLKPLIVIILAVVVAAGAAVYLSRTPDEAKETLKDGAAAPAHVDIRGGGHLRGPETAQITLVEFGDYQCPSCGAYHPLVKEILTRYPQQLRLEFHHFPLISIHQNSMMASMAAEAAGQQGHYWEMHDALFEHQREWSDSPNAEPIFIALASRIGLDINKFMQGLRSPDLQSRVLQDVTRGNDAHVEAVPTFFIKGEQVHVKLSMEDFVQVIEARLHK